MARLILFDVDHTLVDVGKAHRNCFVKAIAEVFGKKIELDTYIFQGKTDLQILQEIVEKEGLPRGAGKIADAIRVMVREFPKQDLRESVLLPGVKALLARLKEKEGIVIGLCTGNIEEIAYTKLRHFGIEEYFLLGGFGHASAIRAELVDIARREAEKRHGKIQEVLVIGDTPGDIIAAKAAGAKCLAVATGMFPIEALIKHSPDFFLDDFSDTEKAMDVIVDG